MDIYTNYSFYLLGQDSLALACIEILLNNDFIPKGIISKDEKLKKWCHDRKLPFFDSPNDLINKQLNKVDLLFSIQNEFILKHAFLKLIKKYAINYHNSLLPKYAGLNATSWAIINNEKEHGITWHLISEEIDAGDIIKQKTFNIDDNETRASLDLKCSSLAKDSFIELINDIKQRRIFYIKQDLSKRTYYSSNDLPAYDGLLNWTLSAEEIDRINRSLIFIDNQANTFSVSKLYINGSYFIIKDYQILKRETSFYKPGTITDVSDTSISISTATYDIVIYKLLTIEGYPISFSKLIELTKIQKGYTLEGDFTNVTAQQITYKQEQYWVNKISHLPSENNLIPIEVTQNDKIERHYQLNITGRSYFNIGHLFNQEVEKWLISISLFNLYLFRLNNYENYYAHLKIDSFEKIPNLFSALLPFNVIFSHNDNFFDVLNKTIKEFNQIKNNLTFKKDILYRYPSLRYKSNNILNPLLLISFKDDSDHLYDSMINLIIDKETGDLEFKFKGDILNSNLVDLLTNYKFILDEMIDQIFKTPGIRLNQINIVSKQHNEIIFNNYHNTYKLLPTTSLIEVFSKIVNSFPNKLAVKYDLQRITFKQLELKAKVLAEYLLATISTGKIIAIILEPSIDYIIAVLGVIYSGNTYLPINTTYPGQFINKILSDSKSNCIITTYLLSRQLDEIVIKSKTIIDINNVNNIKFFRVTKISNNLSPAYVMYTSGSTGEPKGVIIEQASILRLVKDTNYIEILPSDKILQASSVAFDASTFEIWGALLNGATLIILKKEILLNPITFKSFILKNNVTILWLTSALLDKFSKSIPEAFHKLRYLLTGGDIVNPHAIRNLQSDRSTSPKYILNGYGPTENTTFTTTYAIPKLERNTTSIPIGKPISNTYTYVLDKFTNLLPIGAIGELFIGGQGLAIGYLNKPELTADKFIYKDIERKRIRLYKSGDLVRWLSDGNIEFIGRSDQQVKIRGHRIELNAVKQYILSLIDIKDCFIDIQENSNNKSILAYIVPNNTNLDLTELRQQLTQSIPIYMIPDKFIMIDEIPLNLNGKIDKAKLLSQKNILTLNVNKHHPKTLSQKLISELWSKILNIEDIGINENFFDLGGNSLLIAELAVGLKKTLNYTLSIKDFLHNPSIFHLDRLINNKGNSSQKQLKDEVQQDIEIKIPIISGLQKGKNQSKKNILLTGSTGFLGSYILYNLLKQTDSIIYCIVRANTYNEAQQKIHNILLKFPFLISLNKEDIQNRIKIVLGDLSKRDIGIPAHEAKQLSMIIDEIYHVAAEVHHILDYETLRKANVLSTKQLINMAFTDKLKSLYYVSTLSVAAVNSGNYSEEIRLNLDDIDSLQNGYEQTKWASELLLDRAYKSGLDVHIFRPGWIMGDTQYGICPFENNHLLLLLKGCIQMGAAPDWQSKVNMYPVDFLSKAIVQIAQNKEISDFIFNFSNPCSLAWLEIIDRLNIRGYNIRLINENIWFEKFFTLIDKNNAAYTIMPLYLTANKANFNYDPSFIKYSNTENAIKRLNLQFPIIDYKIIDLYIYYLENSHFLAELTSTETEAVI